MVRILKKSEWFHSDGFPIVVERREPQQPFGLHAHDFSELVVITGGAGLHVLSDDSWLLRPGDVFVISGSRPHAYRELEDLRLVNIMYDPGEVQMSLIDLSSLPGYHALFTLEPAWRRRHHFNSRLHLSPSDMRVVISLADRLEAELAERTAGFGFLATSLFMQIIGFLSRCYGRSENPDSRALLRIAEAITYLETHFQEAIDLDHLSTIAGMSKRSFMRAFQAAMGSTPIAYLIQLRVNRAAIMLRTSEASITEIAFQVGFNDSNYFTRQFRRQLGITPREYRRQNLRVVR